MIKILMGGSPCTYWSIAQKNNRETKAEGLGWELFKNYLIAKEKFKPNIFLYENNKSASQDIKDQIKEELGVNKGEAKYIEINSALVSAQNRQRFYVHNCGEVEQPEDRGILLKDILENDIPFRNDKSYCVDANYYKGGNLTNFEKQSGKRLQVAEPINVCDNGKARTIKAQYYKNGVANFITNKGFDATVVACPIRVGGLPRPNGEVSTSQAFRIYSVDAKSVTLNANGGGAGGKTGLYAVPCGQRQTDKSRTITAGYAMASQRDLRMDIETNGFMGKQGVIESAIDYCTPIEFNEFDEPIKAKGYDDKTYVVYKVKDGQIKIRDKEYPIKLEDGYYIIRKLTVKECCRLQTMPDDYCRVANSSNAYKGLGNGWTVEVIIHILNNALKDVPKDEEIVVLSMYDGIGTGRYCLDKMGFTNVKYYSYEIDKHAMEISKSNYPDIIQMGDAFQLRNDDWGLDI